MILILAAFLLAACAAPGAQQPTPAITLLPEAPEPLPPKAASDAEINLSEELGIPREEITIVEWQAAEWPDGCLGLGRPGEVCTQVITPGWRVVLEAEGQQYVARTDQLGQVVRFESGPPQTGAAPGASPTPLAGGEFPLDFYDLVLNFDPQQWSIEPGEGNFNVLAHTQLANCVIREQGPTEPPPLEFSVTLDGITYEVFEGEGGQPGEMVRWYLAREGFENPSPGTIPIVVLIFDQEQAQDCIAAAEQVLGTLRNPF